MTSSRAARVDRRRDQATEGRRVAGVMAARLRGALEKMSVPRAQEIEARNADYRKDPARYFVEVLGFEPWSRQIEIANAVRDHDRVAVRSNNKAGKSRTLAATALWYFDCFPGARVILTAETKRQVDDILYREVKILIAGAGRCVPCKRLDEERRGRGESPGPYPCPHSHIIETIGDAGELAATGIKGPSFSELLGFTAKQAEAVAGISGANLLYIVDEASGRSLDRIYQAILGNLAAGAGNKLALISNPTRTIGEFFDAFHEKERLYHGIHISAFDSPNVKAGRVVIPGLASREFIESSREEFGETSPFFRVRVLGDFPIAEAGQAFTYEAIEQATARWEEAPEDGDLSIGVDVAGESGEGDDSGFAVRRGRKIVALYTRRGLSAEAHLVEALGLVTTYRRGDEEVRVVVDREGEPGAKVWGAIIAWLQAHLQAPPFILIGVRASERAMRDPKTYDRVRDELIASLADWLRDGGALPPDNKLAAELAAVRWVGHVSGRSKLADKKEIRARLGRSPDRLDSVSLACWRPVYLGATAEKSAAPAPAADAYEAPPEEVFDPYEGVRMRAS